MSSACREQRPPRADTQEPHPRGLSSRTPSPSALLIPARARTPSQTRRNSSGLGAPVTQREAVVEGMRMWLPRHTEEPPFRGHAQLLPSEELGRRHLTVGGYFCPRAVGGSGDKTVSEHIQSGLSLPQLSPLFGSNYLEPPVTGGSQRVCTRSRLCVSVPQLFWCSETSSRAGVGG